MKIVHTLVGFALETVAGTAKGTGGVTDFLERCFADPSQRLNKALQRASHRTWQTVEMALAGDSLWTRLKGLLSPADEKAFRQQIRTLLQLAPLPDHPDREQFCQAALAELQAARKAGLLGGVSIDVSVVARRVGTLSSFADPAQRLEAEYLAVQEIAIDLQQAGYRYLAWLLGQRPTKGAPLLVLAMRYFFRREVEIDAELARGLTFSQLEAQDTALRGLHESLRRHGRVVAEQLATLLTVATEARDAAVAGLQTALDLKAEQQRQGHVLTELYQAMAQLLEQNKLQHRPVHQGDSLSIRDTRERQAVKELLARYRSLPAAQRQAAPALLNGLGKLELAIGDFDEAQRAFTQAAEYAPVPAAKAEAHYNAYRAALERRDFVQGLEELRKAAALDPERFMPFPVSKYQPERILGVGGFGATFL
ncbi:MAG TPA: tetratricopeptide repeat protein, partial [Gemmataceae bacterium]|nr:tetratricopeptide repeat protein [Gemmataceae bacterium]